MASPQGYSFIAMGQLMLLGGSSKVVCTRPATGKIIAMSHSAAVPNGTPQPLGGLTLFFDAEVEQIYYDACGFTRDERRLKRASSPVLYVVVKARVVIVCYKYNAFRGRHSSRNDSSACRIGISVKLDVRPSSIIPKYISCDPCKLV